MLQQTVIKAVIPVYARFLQLFPDLRTFAAASEQDVRQAVRGLGYYRRFAFMHKAAQQLASSGSDWPTTFAGWRALPGVGDYTASAVSSIAFNEPAAVVDGNVERVFCRLLDLREPPNAPALKRAFQVMAKELLDEKNPGDFNQALMELGQTVCTVSQPGCKACPIKSVCLAYARDSQSLAPAAKLKGPPPMSVRMKLILLRQGNMIGLVERPKQARFLGSTAGFVTLLETADGEVLGDGWSGAPVHAKLHKLSLKKGEILGSIRHSITHHRIQAEVQLVDGETAGLPVTWLAAVDVERHLISNLDRKAWTLTRSILSHKDTKRDKSSPGARKSKPNVALFAD
jgi:A/G-specific adenine glycosylase